MLETKTPRRRQFGRVAGRAWRCRESHPGPRVHPPRFLRAYSRIRSCRRPGSSTALRQPATRSFRSLATRARGRRARPARYRDALRTASGRAIRRTGYVSYAARAKLSLAFVSSPEFYEVPGPRHANAVSANASNLFHPRVFKQPVVRRDRRSGPRVCKNTNG